MVRKFLTLIFPVASFTTTTDTIYACQDREDDIKAGIKSAAVILGDRVVPFAKGCSAVCIGALAYAGYRNGQSFFYWAITVCATTVHMCWQFSTLDVTSGASCHGMCCLSMKLITADCLGRCSANGKKQVSLLFIVWAGILLDYYAKSGAFRLAV